MYSAIPINVIGTDEIWYVLAEINFQANKC